MSLSITRQRSFPSTASACRPEGAPHSVWELLEHMRIAQNDILLFSKSAKHVSPNWPEGYWPSAPAPKNKAQWNASLKAFRADLAAFEKLILNPKKDLYEPFPWGDGRHFCARLCSSPITTPIIWVNWCWCADCSAPGNRRAARTAAPARW